jgi:RNA polymerase sigma factor (sigma-70 family)
VAIIEPPDTETLYWQWKAAPSAETEAALFGALKTFARNISVDICGWHHPDLVGDIVSHAWEREPRFSGESKFTTWFFALARNQTYSYLRRAARRRKRECQVVEGLPASEAQSGVSDISPLLASLTRELSPLNKKILLSKVEGMTVPETARKFRLSPRAVERRLSKLRQQLRERLAAGERD